MQIMKKNLPKTKIMCTNCPFSPRCLKGWLGKERIKEILSASSFVCHETIDKEERLQCAGHLKLVKEKNEFYKTARVLNLDLDLNSVGYVFKSLSECIKHHSHSSKTL